MRPIPKTINQTFDRALQHLLNYHELIDAMGTPMLNLGGRPKGIRSNRDWEIYLDALLSVQIIGQRNGWTRRHVNRAGRPVYLIIDIPKNGRPVSPA